ncbi:M56 family metallopeptidase [Rufibacter roseus]|uniref:TonB family protein n=1 Tax=Rufibacter roseus TaxID=1567108 RepID=A0ABW2DL87_9BACT|nr:M56 family metallopeptidase [Rufibacter roseus]
MNNAFLQYVAESALCLLLFYLFYWLVLRQETCFRFNRFYLLGALVVATLLPLASLPAWPQAEPEVAAIQSLAYVPLEDYELPVEMVEEEFEKTIDVWPFVYLAYALGLVLFTLRFGYQLFSLYRYAKQEGVYFKLTNHAPVIQTNGKMPTFSFLGYVFFDNTQALTPEETERVLQHERVHLDQRHSLDILLVSVLGIVFWFNPLVRLYKNALEQTHEYLADAEVVRHANHQEYASLLLKQVFQKVGFAMGSYFFFNKSLTLNRIKMMKKLPQSPKTRKVLLLLPLSIGLVSVIMAMRPVQALEPVSPVTSLKEAASSIFLTKDESRPAEFPGGREAANTFVRNNFTFPKIAFDRLNGGDKMVQAVASIEVEIDAAGKATLSRVLEMEVSPNHPQVQEAVKQEFARVVSLMPSWSPAFKNGKAVASKEVIKIASVSTDFLSYSKYLEHRQQKTKVTSAAAEVQASGNSPAEYPGGKGAMYHYLNTQFIIPEVVFKSKVPEDYPVKFLRHIKAQISIDANGFVTGVRPLEVKTEPFHSTEVAVAVDKEFRRLVNKMPQWKPAYSNGKPVASKEVIEFATVVVINGKTTYAQEKAKQEERAKSTYVPTKPTTTPEGEPVFIAVEKMPEFPGGQAAMFKYLAENFKLPAGEGTGTIVGSFVVNKEGKITNMQVLKKLSPSLDEEFVRVVEGMPTWTPGMQNGKAVAVKYTVPFRIQGNGQPQKSDAKTPANNDDDKVYIAVEQMPQFPGGQAAMFKYLSENFKVPAEDQKSGAEGTLVLAFVVTKTGEITNVQVLKSLSPTLDEEALRVVNSMPLWIPGKQNGKAVNVKYTVPYRIVIKDTKPATTTKQD